MLERFSRFGRELFLQRVKYTHSGNMSVRSGNYKAAMVRGHGSFAVGQLLEEAFQWTSSMGASCKTLYPYRLLSPGDREGGKGKW